MTYLSPTPAPPRLHELGPAFRDRLDTAAMQARLGGAGRVYAAHEDYSKPEAPNGWWARVVVLRGAPLWDTQEMPGRERVVRTLVRAEVHSPGGGFDPTASLEAIHAAALAQLEGWSPTATYFTVAHPVFRRKPPPEPVWDEDRGLWIGAAEYRLVVGPA